MNIMLSELLTEPNKAFTIFGADIYWYAICIVSGMIAAIFLCVYLTRFRKGIKKDYVLDVALLAIPFGVAGARVFYALTDNSHKWSFSDLFTRTGGLSIIGGVIGGAIGFLIICAIRKINPLKFLDVIVPCVLLAQAIGRWGNFANQEVYGSVVENGWFPYAVFIDATGSWHLALFFYEFVLNLIGAIILVIAIRKIKTNGVVGFGYFVWYGTVRAILEGFRDSQFNLGNSTMVSRLFSIIMAVGGLAAIIILLYLEKRKKPVPAPAGAAGEIAARNRNDSIDISETEKSPAETESAEADTDEVKDEGRANFSGNEGEAVSLTNTEPAKTSESEEAQSEKSASSAEEISATEQVEKSEPAAPETEVKNKGTNPAPAVKNEIRITEKVVVPKDYKPEAIIIDDAEIDRLSEELEAIERSLIRVRVMPAKKPVAARPAAAKPAEPVSRPAAAKPAEPVSRPAAAKPAARPATATGTTKQPVKPAAAKSAQAAKPAQNPAAKQPAKKPASAAKSSAKPAPASGTPRPKKPAPDKKDDK